MANEKPIKGKTNKNQEDLKNGDTHKVSKHQKEAEKSTESSSSDEARQKIESLLESLKGDISSVATDTAVEMINDLHSLVQHSKEPEAKEIATGLKELQKLLKQKEPKGHDIGELIIHLGEQTSDLSSSASELQAPLQHLGKQLIKTGRSLCKAEDLEYIEDLDSLVSMLEQEPQKIDSQPAVDEISRWYDLLHKSEDASLKSIANELKALKQILKENKPKGADISENLIQLGEHTTQAAANAHRGFKGVIRKLGKTLTTLGKSL